MGAYQQEPTCKLYFYQRFLRLPKKRKYSTQLPKFQYIKFILFYGLNLENLVS